MAIPLSTNIVIISIVFSSLAVLAVFLRFRARYLQKVKLGLDDYLIVPGLIFAVAMGVTNSVAAISGLLGRHMPRDDHGVPQFQDPRFLLFIKMEFLSIVFSPLSLGCTKLSVVCFYRQIFRGNIFSILTITLLVAIAVWGIAFFLAGLFICVPFEAFWTNEPGSKCFNPIPLFYTGAISDTIMDIIILVTPLPLIWQLNLSTRKKIALSGIFLLGIFVLGISASRIALFVEAGKNLGSPDTDMTYDTSPTMYWSQLECSIAVICACLPTLRVVFADVSVQSIRKFASKLSLRSSAANTTDPSRRSGSEPSLPRFREDSVTKYNGRPSGGSKDGSASSILKATHSHNGIGVTEEGTIPLSSFEVSRTRNEYLALLLRRKPLFLGCLAPFHVKSTIYTAGIKFSRDFVFLLLSKRSPSRQIVPNPGDNHSPCPYF
ncbi:hypothetical protein V8F33_009654 [Rhypophila sp. PSN 637]